MAVGTQKTEIRQLVVQGIAVNVVKMEGERLTAPLVNPAYSAPILE